MPETANDIFKHWMDPHYKFFVNRPKEEQLSYLLSNNRMKNEYLGSCLDSIRYGLINAVIYPMNVKKLINFIQEWMKLNENNLIWSYKKSQENYELPFIDYNSCPRCGTNKKTVSDLGGKIRCANIIQGKKIKSNFSESYDLFDYLSQVHKTEYIEIEPRNPRLVEQFNSEEPIIINDICYAILSDKGTILSLEKIIKRLNIFSESTGQVALPFDGWSLALFVEKWYNQLPQGKAPFFNKKNDKDNHKIFPSFRIISSND